MVKLTTCDKHMPSVKGHNVSQSLWLSPQEQVSGGDDIVVDFTIEIRTNTCNGLFCVRSKAVEELSDERFVEDHRSQILHDNCAFCQKRVLCPHLCELGGKSSRGHTLRMRLCSFVHGAN